MSYNLNWARTYLKNAGIIENSARGVWSLKHGYNDKLPFSVEDIIRKDFDDSEYQFDCLKVSNAILTMSVYLFGKVLILCSEITLF